MKKGRQAKKKEVTGRPKTRARSEEKKKVAKIQRAQRGEDPSDDDYSPNGNSKHIES